MAENSDDTAEVETKENIGCMKMILYSFLLVLILGSLIHICGLVFPPENERPVSEWFDDKDEADMQVCRKKYVDLYWGADSKLNLATPDPETVRYTLKKWDEELTIGEYKEFYVSVETLRLWEDYGKFEVTPELKEIMRENAMTWLECGCEFPC